MLRTIGEISTDFSPMRVLLLWHEFVAKKALRIVLSKTCFPAFPKCSCTKCLPFVSDLGNVNVSSDNRIYFSVPGRTLTRSSD